MMLVSRLGSVLEDLGSAPHDLRDKCRGHRRSDTDLRLTAALRCGESGVVFAQVTDGQAGE